MCSHWSYVCKDAHIFMKDINPSDSIHVISFTLMNISLKWTTFKTCSCVLGLGGYNFITCQFVILCTWSHYHDYCHCITCISIFDFKMSTSSIHMLLNINLFYTDNLFMFVKYMYCTFVIICWRWGGGILWFHRQLDRLKCMDPWNTLARSVCGHEAK